MGPDGKKTVANVQDLIEQSFAESELTLSAVSVDYYDTYGVYAAGLRS